MHAFLSRQTSGRLYVTCDEPDILALPFHSETIGPELVHRYDCAFWNYEIRPPEGTNVGPKLDSHS